MNAWEEMLTARRMIHVSQVQVVLPLGWFGWNFFRRRRLVFNAAASLRALAT
jgi:hypothetical protein